MDAPSRRLAVEEAAHALLSVLSLQISLSMVFLVFSTMYLPLVVQVLLPQRYLSTSAPEVLGAWMWYIPVLAINGGLEAFLSSTSSTKDLNNQSRCVANPSFFFCIAQFLHCTHCISHSRWMVVFSIIYISSVLGMYRLDVGDVGLVYANIINLSARIAYALSFVWAFFEADAPGAFRVRDVLRNVMPDARLSLVSLFSFVVIRASGGKEASKDAQGLRGLLSAPVISYVSLGGFLFLVCSYTAWVTRSHRPKN